MASSTLILPLVLLLRDEVVHVAVSLSELHLMHSLTYVPVEEGLPAEYSAAASEGDYRLEAMGWDVAVGHLDIVGDPPAEQLLALFCTLNISSTSFSDISPQKTAYTMRY